MCSVCSRRVDAKTIFEEDKVQMLKRWPQTDMAWVLVADDVDYYRSSREVVIEVPDSRWPQIHGFDVIQWASPGGPSTLALWLGNGPTNKEHGNL